MHVLPKGFHRIRHFGLLANGGDTRAEKLARARQLIIARSVRAVRHLHGWRIAIGAIAYQNKAAPSPVIGRGTLRKS
jgi:hypothetical protein